MCPNLLASGLPPTQLSWGLLGSILPLSQLVSLGDLPDLPELHQPTIFTNAVPGLLDFQFQFSAISNDAFPSTKFPKNYGGDTLPGLPDLQLVISTDSFPDLDDIQSALSSNT